MNDRITFAIIVLVLLWSCMPKKKAQQAWDNFEDYVGKAPIEGGFKMDDYWVWGASCVKGEDNRYHLFASRWPKKYPFLQGYVFYSEVVHATSNTPEGPYIFEEVALSPRGEMHWDGRMTHNPTIVRWKDTYYLYYIGSTYAGDGPTADSLLQMKRIFQQPAYKNIRIGLATSTSPFGPWERRDQPILSPQPHGFDSIVATNPAPCLTESGEVMLIYRTHIRGEGNKLAVAQAKTPEGPYKRLVQHPIASAVVEDPFIWQKDGIFYIIAKDMTGNITGEKHAGVFLKTNDITKWQLAQHPKAYSRTVIWNNGDTTVQGSFERPQLLLDNGVPKFLFAATADGPGGFYAAENTWNMVIPLHFP